jgi:hypothetical protein
MLRWLLKQVLQRTVAAAHSVAQQSGEWAAVIAWSFYDCPVTLHSSSSSSSSSRGGGSSGSSASAGANAGNASGKRKSASNSGSSNRAKPSPSGASIITTVMRGADQHGSELVAVIAAESLRPVT